MNAALETIRECSVYELAKLADCGMPDTKDSPGGTFLDLVRLGFIEELGRGEFSSDTLRDDTFHEIADSAPDTYTHARWQQFTDLCAYEEEIPPDVTDWTEAASYVLAEIAYRLLRALWDQYTENDED
jgi:hypothetical protein